MTDLSPAADDGLEPERLERAIGLSYRPARWRASLRFEACLPARRRWSRWTWRQRNRLRNRRRCRDVANGPGSSPRERPVRLQADGVLLDGDLHVPDGARGLVLFAHGSGSSRHSPRNRAVAQALQRAGLGTLLMDLLTREEEAAEARTGHLRFDIDLLSGRLAAATDWLRQDPQTASLLVGYFGASTGAAAALVAAAARPDAIAAVVSRGGRPDLAGEALTRVRAPTLLIVGGDDTAVIELNRQACALLRVEKALEIVPGASHLFEEPGALETVARLASGWFARHFV